MRRRAATGLGPVLTDPGSEAACVADDGSAGGGIFGLLDVGLFIGGFTAGCG